ncbi:MAG TPA: hypothetical protein IAC43_01890 [Candidatus Faecivivens stercoripullorum]|uniref:Uncharacterized protein n=1 Tax=Candidatus Faecivivens stercoripullorum TaxID=2840805 RepID=A0A9D1H6V1_9FIRM|nr:hypothetical protein [Candidatus Faecivivens stercoripullorum]
MAKYERSFNLPLQTVVRKVEDVVLQGSMSASLEACSDFTFHGVGCAVRVFERYSWLGSNRVSMSVTMIGDDHATRLVAVTSGGSQAVFFKVNTWGEESFLDTLTTALEG